jgi:DNA integrity scanning protein DisA with diadenylate cyclase activity/mannitol/fructose-specific phosphotransferase system IIA component (Ntr-type)
MAFRKYIRLNKVVDLTSEDKVASLKELAQALCRASNIRKQKPIIDEMLRREEAASTFIGQGIAIPQTRAQIKDDFAIAVGRSLGGIAYDAARGARAHIIVLVIINESLGRTPIELLSEIATSFKAKSVRDALLTTEETPDLTAILTRGGERENTRKARRMQSPVLASALSMSREMKAASVVVFADAMTDDKFLDLLPPKERVIVVTSDKTRFEPDDKRFSALVQAPPFSTTRTGQIKIGILLALSRKLIKKSDKVVCVSGNGGSGVFDTVVTLDVAKEYELFLTTRQAILPPDVRHEVLERLLGLAGEIALEGREGRPTGTIFVVGDTNSVNAYVRQLIINPFRGYSETERSILDPALAETIKEFAAIDGAFVITGDGVVLSAGSYLRPPEDGDGLPSGLGARHAAAAGITASTNALAVAISESTGMVSMFKDGKILMTLSKPSLREREEGGEEL